jgi:C4-type Zn-finger protein
MNDKKNQSYEHRKGRPCENCSKGTYQQELIDEIWDHKVICNRCLYRPDEYKSKNMKEQSKRAIHLEGLDQILILSKATAVKTDKNMIYLDELEDGTWRLIYNKNMIPDFTKLEALKIIRDDSVDEPLK